MIEKIITCDNCYGPIYAVPSSTNNRDARAMAVAAGHLFNFFGTDDLCGRCAAKRGAERRGEATPPTGRSGDHNPTPDAATVAGNKSERP